MGILQLDHKEVLGFFPPRPNDSYKGNYGKNLLLCGSKGYTGAAYFAAMGALRVGAGLVFLAVPESIYVIEAMKLNEPIVQALPDEDGKYAAEAIQLIRELMQGKDVVLAGPGMGQSLGTTEVTCTILKEFQGTVILDADGINVMRYHIDVLRERTYPIILTPHDGEFARIGGNLSIDRIEAATSLAKDLGAIVLLKGHRTIITDGNYGIFKRVSVIIGNEIDLGELLGKDPATFTKEDIQLANELVYQKAQELRQTLFQLKQRKGKK